MKSAFPNEVAKTVPLQFVRQGRVVSVENVPPSRTLLELLRDDLGLHSVKEGCNQGDCGACTVVVGSLQDDRLQYRAVNSCLRLAHSVQGRAIWTAQDLPQPSGTLHPVQQALVQHHASQCGFCTPGVVMSLFALYQQRQGHRPNREETLNALSGNLCRCTGYRPMVAAALSWTALEAPADAAGPSADTRAALSRLTSHQPEPPEEALINYHTPRSLDALLRLRCAHPEWLLVAGGTDAVLSFAQPGPRPAHIVDLNHVPELQQQSHSPTHWRLGAALPLTEAFAALLEQRPHLQPYLQRFASHPIRNSATLGGNLVNASPIGDTMPLLIALQARVTLLSWSAKAQRVDSRTLPVEQLYLAYRRTCMQAHEVVGWVDIPHPAPKIEHSWAYKVSKRREDDITTVSLAVCLHLDHGRVTHATIGVGGVAATPARAWAAEAALQQQPWTADTVQQAMDALSRSFQPLDDVRASAQYRQALLRHLLWRVWLDSQHTPHAPPLHLDECLPLPAPHPSGHHSPTEPAHD